MEEFREDDVVAGGTDALEEGVGREEEGDDEDLGVIWEGVEEKRDDQDEEEDESIEEGGESEETEADLPAHLQEHHHAASYHAGEHAEEDAELALFYPVTVQVVLQGQTVGTPGSVDVEVG